MSASIFRAALANLGSISTRRRLSAGPGTVAIFLTADKVYGCVNNGKVLFPTFHRPVPTQHSAGFSTSPEGATDFDNALQSLELNAAAYRKALEEQRRQRAQNSSKSNEMGTKQ